MTNSIQKGLIKPLPDGINILTLEKWKDNEILLRLENLNEMEEVKIEPEITKIFHPKTFRKCRVVNLVGQPMTGNVTTVVEFHSVSGKI